MDALSTIVIETWSRSTVASSDASDSRKISSASVQ
jgi:hypothetical protein